MSVQRFRNGQRFVDLDLEERDRSALSIALAARGFTPSMADRDDGERLAAEDVAALFSPPPSGQIQGPDALGGTSPMGHVGDIRIRGGLAVPF